ncbi:hypothetical protein ACV1C6_21510 [Aeromonas sanarellii]
MVIGARAAFIAAVRAYHKPHVSHRHWTATFRLWCGGEHGGPYATAVPVEVALLTYVVLLAPISSKHFEYRLHRHQLPAFRRDHFADVSNMVWQLASQHSIDTIKQVAPLVVL